MVIKEAKSLYSPYTMLGHFAWKQYREWMSNPDNKGIPLPEEISKQIEARGQILGLSSEDRKQAIHEGEIAARIDVDPEFASTQTISGLNAESRSPLSPLACVARKLGLIGMLQNGDIAGYVLKQTGKDILPELQQGLADIKINP